MADKWSGARVALAFTAAIVIVILFGVTVLLPHGVTATQLTQGALAVVLAVLVVTYLRLAYLSQTTEAPLERTAEVRAVTVPDLEAVHRVFDNNGRTLLTADHVRVFIGAIVAPTSFMMRISEHVESYHRSHLIRSTFAVRVDDPGARVSAEDADEVDFVMPLFLPTKRNLTDGVKVTNSKGIRVSTIDSDALSVYVAAVLRYALYYLAGRAAFDEYIANDHELERAALLAVASPDVPVDQLNDVTDRLLMLPADPGREPLLQVAADFVRELAKGRPICVVIPATEVREQKWPSSFRYTLERRIIPPTEPAPSGAARIKYGALLDHLRLALGVRLNRIYFPLSNAYRTGSYHLEIAGPVGTYLAGDEFIPPALAPSARLQFQGSNQALYGQRRSHLYVHGLDGQEGAYYFAKFFERAPGSFAGATIASVVSTVLIIVLELMNASADKGVQSHISSVVPTLLALPVGIAAFVGLEAAQGTRHPSLLSRLVVFATATLSLSAFVLAAARGLNGATPQWAWQLLLWTSVGTTLVSLLTWGLRLVVENHFVRRSPGDKGT